MNRTITRGFTLAELLIVVAIVGVLLALLGPAVTSAWDTAAMTKCQMNLAQIWKAQNSRRADKDQSVFTAGGAWPSMLAPYVEHAADVLRCPLGPDRPQLAVYLAGSGAGGLEDPGPGAGSSGQTIDPGAPENQGFTLDDLTFRMFARTNCDVSGRKYVAGQYLGTAFVTGGFGVKREDLGGGKICFGIDDRQFFDDKNVGGVDYRDIRVNVQLDGDWITSVAFIGGDEGTGGSYNVFRFEVWMADEMISDDFRRDYGMTIGLDRRTGGDPGAGGSGGAGNPTGGTGPTTTLNELAAIKAFDYGLNKGTYQVLDSTVQRLDQSVILMLDYGKSVANYANKGPDPWPLYFTATEEAWMANQMNVSFLKPGETWWHYTAMRHFGMANVLFCDGHIELLGPD
ncbi:MAG: type II secretion system protein, partial [Planctomycetes bacterium]|nr:type II secretion system protein [Planctomycetota bacterium]